MKKIIFLLFAIVTLGLISCTENDKVLYGKEVMTINLPRGEKLVSASWDHNAIIIMTEPMKEDYEPTAKYLYRKTSDKIGAPVTFIESK